MSKYILIGILMLTGVGTIPAMFIFICMTLRDQEDARIERERQNRTR